MNSQGLAAQAAERRVRGWLPMVALPGNALLMALDPVIAMRLKHAIGVDPRIPLDIVATVEDALRDLLEEVVA